LIDAPDQVKVPVVQMIFVDVKVIEGIFFCEVAAVQLKVDNFQQKVADFQVKVDDYKVKVAYSQ
jgi:hypothetical protein